MSDISGLIGSTGVALESEAYRQFGAAVENQVSGELGKIFTTASTQIAGPNDAASVIKNVQTGVWDPTPYASALTNFSGGFDPKNKFLFKVEFKFHPEPAQMASSLGFNVNDISRDLTFVVKSIDLPKVKFDYEEVNMYNFKTKILKGIAHENLNLVFYDDVANHALAFVNAYMMLFSPITRNKQQDDDNMENHGFAFNPNYQGLDTGNRGAIANGNRGRKDILKSLTIDQFYVNMSDKTASSLPNLVRVNSFIFTNPRLAEYNTQNQDHESGSEAATISASFDYDALHITLGGDGMGATTVLGNTFPGGDILNGYSATEANIIRGQSGSAAGNNRNPFIDILARQGSRMAQTTVSNALRGMFGDVAGGALSTTISSVSGTLGQATAKTLANAASGVSQAIARPSPTLVTDNAGVTTPPSQVISSSE
jgi:hypothetical protein